MSGDDPTLDEIHLGLDMLDAEWDGEAWCDPLTMSPMHACGDCRPVPITENGR